MILTILTRVAETASDIRVLACARIRSIDKWKIFGVYCQLSFKSRLDRFFHFSEQSFLGYRVTTGPYHHFATFFREIFVRQSYYFRTDSTSPLILDCGSNVGLSVLYFKWLYPQAKIVAFEPCPPLFEILKKNCEQNHLEDVTVVKAAVADKAGVIELHFPSHKPMGGAATIMPKAAETKQEVLKHGWEAVQVETISLSDYISGPIQLLKMDIEGAELVSFKNMEESSSLAHIEQGIIEFHYNEQNEQNDFIEFLSLLKKNLFSVTTYQEREMSDPSGYALHKRGFHNFMIRITKRSASAR